MTLRQRKTKVVAEFGDFQTPVPLAVAAVRLLRSLGVAPRRILEPTCGKGSFLAAAAAEFPDVRQIFGLEINRDHLAEARSALQTTGMDACRFDLRHGDFFATDWESVISQVDGPWLILGNPPWVTNAELGAIASANLPQKSNFQGRSGIEAVTGKSNFDICEWMLLKYLDWLKGRRGTIAVLCKTSVARKILLQAWKHAYPLGSARIYKIDALSHFGAAVDACFFIAETGRRGETSCAVFDSLDASAHSTTLGYRDGHLVIDIVAFDRHSRIGGADRNYIWRSGIKHDCSKLMELAPRHAGYENGLGETVDIEDRFLFPMLKSSDVGNGRSAHRSMMLVTQRTVGEDTSIIRREAPKTWRYLESHREFLDRRGSSIYRNKPPFSVFGVGPYSFSPWKVAISGFYKRLSFVKVSSPATRNPIVFDDTVYFLPCWSEEEADFLHSVLTSPSATEFYRSMIHWDEKRPITVDLLRRLNIEALAQDLGRIDEYRRFIAQASGPLFAQLTAATLGNPEPHSLTAPAFRAPARRQIAAAALALPGPPDSKDQSIA